MKRNLTTAEKQSPGKTWMSAVWRRDARPLLGILVRWTVWTILALNLVTVLLYVIGSYQRAPDSYQLALVRVCLVLSLLMIISSFYGIILDIYYMLRRRRKAYLFGILGYVMVIALGAALALGAAFILGAVGGNLPG